MLGGSPGTFKGGLTSLFRKWIPHEHAQMNNLFIVECLANNPHPNCVLAHHHTCPSALMLTPLSHKR